MMLGKNEIIAVKKEERSWLDLGMLEEDEEGQRR